MKNSKQKLSGIIMAIALISLLYSPLFAQQEADTIKYEFDPVLVTGTMAKERETPVTFTNLHKETIEQRYSMQDVPVMLAELPSMISYSDGGNGIGYNYMFLRGFDQRRLSIMVNGIPQNDPEDHNVYWIDFPDLLASSSSVQVQRGAGSALYGPPAIGGSVNIITNPFTSTPSLKIETMAGFQEFGDSSSSLPLTMQKYSLSFNSGLIDNSLMIYGRYGKILSDGYRNHSWIKMDSYFFGAMYVANKSTTRFHMFGGPLQDALVYLGLPKSVNPNYTLRRMNFNESGNIRRTEEKEKFYQPHYEILNEWKISATEKLDNTVFFYDSHGQFDIDGSWGDAATLRVDSLHGFVPTPTISNAIIRAGVDLLQWGWLPRYEWQHDRGELTVGGEYRYHLGKHWGKIQYAEGLPSHYDPEYRFYQYDGIKHMASVYMTENFKLQDEMTLMANLQLAYNEYQIRNEKFLDHSFSVPYLFVNPRLGLNYNVTEEWNAYVSFGYTTREPRMRNLYAAEDAYWDPNAVPQFSVDTSGGSPKYDFDKPLVKPEQLLNIELGAGYHADGIEVNSNVYLMEFTDELVKSGQVDIFGNPVYGNAPRTRHLGAEFDAAVQLMDYFVVSGNASISTNNIVSFAVVDSFSGGTVYRTSLNNNPIAGFPGVTANLRLTYQRDGSSISLVAKHVGAFYTDNFKNSLNRNDAYTVLNVESVLALTATGDAEIGVRGEVRNLLNTLYLQNGEGNAFFPAAERNYMFGMSVQW